MATPFTVFRKYSGIMMAFFGALLMLSFVVADPLMTWMSGGNGSGAPSGGKEVAVTWNGGKLTEQQLGQLVKHRRILAQFQDLLPHHEEHASHATPSSSSAGVTPAPASERRR